MVMTPAHGAALKGHVDALRCLHQLVPDTLSAQDNIGRTPAHIAAFEGHVDALQCLHQLVPDTLSAQDIMVHPSTSCRTKVRECAPVPS